MHQLPDLHNQLKPLIPELRQKLAQHQEDVNNYYEYLKQANPWAIQNTHPECQSTGESRKNKNFYISTPKQFNNLKLLHKRRNQANYASIDAAPLKNPREHLVNWALIITGETIHENKGQDKTTQKIQPITKENEQYCKQHGVTSYTQIVSYWQWHHEITWLTKYMQQNPGCIVIFDGSLINSFLNEQPREHQNLYRKQLTKAIHISQQTNSILAGYIDDSHATDIIDTLYHDNPEKLARKTHITDAQVLNKHLTQIGSRTPRLTINRPQQQHHTGPPIDCFYGKYGPGHPARIEIPTHITTHQLNQLHGLLYTISHTNHGYPYLIQQCHNQTQLDYHTKKIIISEITRQLNTTLDKTRKTKSKH